MRTQALQRYTVTLRRTSARHFSTADDSTSSSSFHSHHRRSEGDAKSIQDDQTYCVNLVRERDRQAYLCGLLMPEPSRDAFFALRATNVEVASIKDGHNLRKNGSYAPVMDETAGGIPATLALQLRMQWWRDAVEEIYDGSDGATLQNKNGLSISCWNSPVVRSLDRANHKHNFTRRFLERLIDARELDLEVTRYNTMNDCISYADETVASLLFLTLESCGVRDDAADMVASHVGIGTGLTTALRATPFRLANAGELPLPTELFRPGFPYDQLVPTFLGEEKDMVLSESDAAILYGAVEHMAAIAMGHFVQARNAQSDVPKKARAALLPVVPALQYLSKLEDAKYNLFDSSVTTGSNSDQLRLLMLLSRTWMTGIF